MTKQELLEVMRLLAALESWSYVCKEALPKYLLEQIDVKVKLLEREILK